MRNLTILLFLSFVIPSFAKDQLVIPTGVKLFIENKTQSDEATLFKDALERKIAKDESDKRYLKPGFPIVTKREDADYVLHLMVVVRTQTKTSIFDDAKTTHAIGNVSLLANPDGKEVWFYEFDCTGSLLGGPTERCVAHISDELKSNQVNSEGKRAGMLGWKVKK